MPLPIYRKQLQERPHISFSEALVIDSCPYNHWVTYRENAPRETSIYTVYGTEVGAAIEKYKNGNKLAWIGLGKAILKYIKENGWGEIVPDRHQDAHQWVRCAWRNLTDTIKFLDEKYPGWKLLGFEYELFQDIPDSKKKFKGYIDIIFEYKDRIKILDFKTTTKSWDKDKRSDTKKLYQVSLYKHFYCQKTGTDPNNVDVGYLLLIREPAKKADSSIELFEQTSGPKKLENAVNWLSECAKRVEIGVQLKNKTDCRFCKCGESDDEKKWAAYREKKKREALGLP